VNGLRFVEKLANSPWLCDAAHVEFLHSIFMGYMERVADGRPLDRQAVEQTLGRPLDNTRAVTVQNGVAKIPVVGTIFRRASLFTEISGGISTETIAKDFATAYNDNTVHSILFVFDSPGGEATGINELAGSIREKRDEGVKRIEAYCDGDCASGAYWLASATSLITTDPTSALGSIGVVSRVRNPEAAGKKLTLEFWNSRSPRKRIDPNSYEGQAAIQEYIDDMGDEFIRAVADNRGVSFEEVERDFGQGFVMTGRKAVQVGLADALGSEEGVIARLQEERASPVRLRPVAARVLEARASPARLRPVAAHVGEQAPLSINRDALYRFAAEQPAVPNPHTEEVATQMSENATREAANGREGADAPAGEERRETGFMAHMRAFFTGEGAQPAAPSREEDEGSGANDGVREDMTETTQQTTGAVSAEEAEDLRAQVVECRGQVETLRGEKADLARELAETRVSAEIADAHRRGVEPWMTKAAQPDLLGAAMEPDNEAAQERAARWRSTLDASKGKVKFGEEGVGEGRGLEGMTDDQKVRATIAERGLNPTTDYGRVAGELVAAGEIRRGALAAEGEE
jgi:ClpP class serine protease